MSIGRALTIKLHHIAGRMGRDASSERTGHYPICLSHIVGVGPANRQSVNTHGIEVLRPWETTDSIAQGVLRSHRAPCTGVTLTANGAHVEVVSGRGGETVNDDDGRRCGGSTLKYRCTLAVGKARGTVLNLVALSIAAAINGEHDLVGLNNFCGQASRGGTGNRSGECHIDRVTVTTGAVGNNTKGVLRLRRKVGEFVRGVGLCGYNRTVSHVDDGVGVGITHPRNPGSAGGDTVCSKVGDCIAVVAGQFRDNHAVNPSIVFKVTIVVDGQLSGVGWNNESGNLPVVGRRGAVGVVGRGIPNGVRRSDITEVQVVIDTCGIGYFDFKVGGIATDIHQGRETILVVIRGRRE